MKSIKVNFLMNIVLTMSSFIFPLITFPYVSRVLMTDGLGKVQMAASFVSYFMLLSQLGIPTYGVRACAAVRDDRRELSRTVQELTIIYAVMTVVSYAAFFVTIQAVPRLREERMLYFVTSASVVLGMLGMEWLFRALEQYSYITIRSLIFKVISVVAMFLLVHSREDYVLYAGITVFASSGSSLMNLTQLRKYIDLRPVGNYRIRRHLRPVLILFAYTCATTIYTNLDAVMLGFMTTDSEVGCYTVAVKVKTILVSVITALGTVLLPRVSYYFEQGNLEEFWKMVEKGLRFVLIMAFPLTLYFMLFAKNSVFLLSGPEYGRSVLPMILIMPTLLFIGTTSVTALQILIPTGRENVVLWASICGAVTDLVINWVLIPPMGAAGAAIGTLAAEGVVLLVQWFALRQELAPISRKLRIGTLLLAVLAGGAASFWVLAMPWADFWILALSAVLFFGIYALVLHLLKEPMFRELEQQGMELLKSRLGRKR